MLQDLTPALVEKLKQCIKAKEQMKIIVISVYPTVMAATQ